jgi:hypothetical protein
LVALRLNSLVTLRGFRNFVNEKSALAVGEVGAHAGIIVHHTPKDGKTMFGTQALLASVDWVWRSDAIDATSATLTCERMKSARAFAKIKLTFHSVQLRMAPNYCIVNLSRCETRISGHFLHVNFEGISA